MIGHRLREVMLAIAVGGVWPRARRRELPRPAGSGLCPRCRREPEAQLSRGWTRDANTGKEALLQGGGHGPPGDKQNKKKASSLAAGLAARGLGSGAAAA